MIESSLMFCLRDLGQDNSQQGEIQKCLTVFYLRRFDFTLKPNTFFDP
jgi:hypothetical protein